MGLSVVRFWAGANEKELGLTNKGPSTKDVRQMGRGVILKFRTLPDGGRGGGVVCESSDVRKFLKKIEIPKLKIIIDRDSNMRAFT